jgi:cytochrome o ubiquinol oxidase subunit 2
MFRATNHRARYDPEFTYSGRIELIAHHPLPRRTDLYGSYHLDPRRPIESGQRALEVQVVALDWKWLFLYPDQGVGTVNQLVVPAGVPVHFAVSRYRRLYPHRCQPSLHPDPRPKVCARA